MSTIPTARDFILQNRDRFEKISVDQWLIEFAQLHVEAALKAASSSASFAYNGARGKVHTIVYPLENIK